MLFDDFNFDPSLMEGLNSMGFKSPTPIQEQAIPLILSNRDLIACAQTGTGKTAAYLLPVIHKIIQKGHGSINTLIIAPTRELAIQIDEAIHALSYFTSNSAIAVYGGNDGIMFEQEKRAFAGGVDMIAATPGRLLSHIRQGSINFNELEHLILDEADRMLDMGFYDDIMQIISALPEKRQTLMFSATMPPKIRTLAKKLLHDPAQINIAMSKPAEGVLQEAFVVYDEQKIGLLNLLLRGKRLPSVLIFASTKEKVKRLEQELSRSGLKVAAIHSDLEQPQRKAVLRRFSSKELPVLIATDILSRGIDIDSISMVINFDVPGDAEDYIHRVGRTARAESTGIAVTFINPKDQRKFKRVEELIGEDITKIPLPEQLGKGPDYAPHLNRESKPSHHNGNRNKRFRR